MINNRTTIERINSLNSIMVTPRLITFNCLSPYYARPDWLIGVQEKHLDADTRLNRLEQLMRDSWFKAKFIIALQELSLEWSKRIQQLCDANGYSLVYSSYSSEYMGVGIAFPNSHYRLVASDIFDGPKSVRSHIDKMSALLDSTNSGLNDEDKQAMKVVVNSFSKAENKPFENSLVSALLRPVVNNYDSGLEILITTYHMPCRFAEQIYMICQAREMLSRQSDLIMQSTNINRKDLGLTPPSRIVPIIMADCNIGPTEPAYQILTGIDNTHMKLMNQIIMSYAKIGIDFLNYQNMQSASVLVTGSEPKFTNVKLADPCNTRSKPFIETIDYILVPFGTHVKSFQLGLTPKEGNMIGAYPNAICPSDHLPLSATIQII